MEKRRSHYDLHDIQECVSRKGMDSFTLTAITNAKVMGLTADQSLAVVMSLRPTMFYKSMTMHHNSSVWQDVYHAPTQVGRTAYIKVTLQDGAVVIQFKEK